VQGLYIPKAGINLFKGIREEEKEKKKAEAPFLILTTSRNV
jgi:hypothetical protein